MFLWIIHSTYARLTFSMLCHAGRTKTKQYLLYKYKFTFTDNASIWTTICNFIISAYSQIGSSHNEPVQSGFAVPAPHKHSWGCTHVPWTQPVLTIQVSQFGLVHPGSQLWKWNQWNKKFYRRFNATIY